MNKNSITNSNELITKASKDSGLSTAWLLATLGSKTTYKKLVRKDILSISIPQTCNIIGNPHSTIPLRLSSNLLYGVSLMYKQKIDYFLSDVSLIKTKLQKEIFLNTLNNKKNFTVIDINHSQVENLQSKDQLQIFLKEDPLFDVNADFIRSFHESEEIDGRRLQIKQLDQMLYPNQNNSFFSSVASQTTIYPDMHAKTIENFMNQELNTLHEMSESFSEDPVDFEFGNDGEIIDLYTNQNPQEENKDLSIIDFDQLIESDASQEIQELTSGINDKTITNDKTFHISNDTHTNQTTTLNFNKSIKRKRNFRKLILDEKMKIPSNELKNFRDNYNKIMHFQNKRFKTEKQVNDRIDSIQQLVYEENIHEPFATNYSYKFIFGSDIAGKIPLKSKFRKYSVDKIKLNEDLEFGRNIEPTVYEEEIEKFNFELDQDLPIELNESQDIFDISFPEINNSEIRSRSESKRSNTKSTRSSSLSKHEQHDFFEESLDYTPGAPNLQTQKIDSQTKLNATLIKFLSFLQSRSILLGEQVKSDYKLSRNYFKYLDKETTGSQEIIYSKVKFSTLIPSKKTKLEKVDDVPVNRKLAANSFSSILQLATRNYIIIEKENNYDLLAGEQIEVLIEI